MGLRGFQACDFALDVGDGLAQFAVVGCGEAIAGKVVKIVDWGVDRCEAI